MLSAILLAAGRGSRFKQKGSKVLAEINSKPVIYYSLLALSRQPGVDEIIVVTNSRNIRKVSGVIRKYKIGKVRRVTLGGLERQDSVLKGLHFVSPKSNYVLIHDAARPFINSRIVASAMAQAKRSGAAVSGVPVKATVKEIVNRVVKKTLERERLWEVQTPQVFRKNLLIEAYKKFGRERVTDDASLVEKLGARISMVMGSYANIKITTPEDLIIARAIAKKSG